MKNKSSLIIFFAALLITTYVLFDYFDNQPDPNQQRLDEYLANQGLEPREGEEEYTETDDFGAYAGMFAPKFSLPSWDETNNIELANYRGSFVIVNAWASWCPPCREEIPFLIEFHENYLDDLQVEVVGINMTTTEANVTSATTFIEDFNIPYDIGMDLEGFIEKEYRIFSLPMTFVIDPEGKILIRKTGYMDYNMIVDLYEEALEIYNES